MKFVLINADDMVDISPRKEGERKMRRRIKMQESPPREWQLMGSSFLLSSSAVLISIFINRATFPSATSTR